jgi:hypothetical protein
MTESTIENRPLAEITEEQAAALRDGLEEPFDRLSTVSVFANLALQLRDKLDSYETVLSDDASGRIVSRVFETVINKARKEKKEEFAPTYFLAGGRDMDNTEAITEFLREKGNLGKTLLVTENINKGKSISRIIGILSELGIDFDLATPSINEKLKDEMPEALDHLREEGRLYFGRFGPPAFLFHGQRDFSGVIKDRGQKSAHPRVIRPDVRKQDRIKQSRDNASILADRLYKLISKT